MKAKLLDLMLLIFCVGTLVNTAPLIIENLQFVLFLIGWCILLLVTFYLILTGDFMFFKRKSKEEKYEDYINENIKDPKN